MQAQFYMKKYLLDMERWSRAASRFQVPDAARPQSIWISRPVKWFDAALVRKTIGPPISGGALALDPGGDRRIRLSFAWGRGLKPRCERSRSHLGSSWFPLRSALFAGAFHVF